MLVLSVKLGQKIAIRMAEVGVKTYAELAKRMANVVTPTSISRWVSDEEFPKGRYLKPLARALEISIDDLLSGKKEKIEVITEPPPVYVISYAEAGAGKSFDDSGYPTWSGYDSVSRPPDLKDENAYALKIKGDSMAPAIEEGWIVIIAPNYQVRSKDFVIVKDVAENVRLKKIKFDGEIVQLYSVNSAYPPEIYQKKDLIFIHKVYAIIPR